MENPVCIDVPTKRKGKRFRKEESFEENSKNPMLDLGTRKLVEEELLSLLFDPISDSDSKDINDHSMLQNHHALEEYNQILRPLPTVNEVDQFSTFPAGRIQMDLPENFFIFWEAG
jgi:hypothetical protein